MYAEDVLRRYGIRPRKKLGQNFLVNDGIAGRIVDNAASDEQAVVLEIGAGSGVLTHQLVEQARHVIAVEIDSALQEVLRRELGANPNFTLMPVDILRVDLEEVCRTHGAEQLTVIGNIPYNITGPLLERLLTYRPVIRGVILMTQEEVGLRLAAEPGTKAYGALTVIVRYAYDVERLFRVGPGNFVPRPAIQSVVLRLTPHLEPPVNVCDEALLIRVIKASFQHRRKMLHHAVNRLLPESADAVAEQSGIDLRRRGETLSLDEFGRLTDTLRQSGLQ